MRNGFELSEKDISVIVEALEDGYLHNKRLYDYFQSIDSKRMQEDKRLKRLNEREKRMKDIKDMQEKLNGYVESRV